MKVRKKNVASLREIAQIVGISHVHVDRILYNKGVFSLETERKVYAAIRLLESKKAARVAGISVSR